MNLPPTSTSSTKYIDLARKIKEIEIQFSSQEVIENSFFEKCISILSSQIDNLTKQFYNEVLKPGNLNQEDLKDITPNAKKVAPDAIIKRTSGRRKADASDSPEKQIKSLRNKKWKLKKEGKLTPEIEKSLEETLQEINLRKKEPYKISD